jgi:beta-N-acetylhexosaminidase
MNARAFITGLSGLFLTERERGYLRETRPWGLILFKRNVQEPAQIVELIGEAREAVGAHVPVLVDQEGGRVQRLGPPHWPVYPPGAAFVRLFGDDERAAHAARLGARLIAADLDALGIDVNCVPIADVPIAGADSVIGDRAYADTPDRVATIAAAVAEGLMQGGVLPVLKHIPGHGRANADSHLSLPVVHADRATLERTDFVAFRPLKNLPLGMTAHVVYSAIDPVHPATTSATIMREVIRGSIGFTGLLMSDDISMGALSGSIAERTRAALAAGCDLVLHCNGKLDEMEEVAAEAAELTGAAARRAAAALAARKPPSDIDLPAARREFTALMNLQVNAPQATS